MRAAMYGRLGSADVLQVVDLPRPEPAPGEVRVRIRASGVNPTDWKARTDGPLQAKTVLVAGGAGAVGHFAIELARRGGARVIITVSSPEKADVARAAGADEVINYRAEDAASTVRAVAPDGVDRIIIEVALSADLTLDLQVLAPDGTVVTYAATGPNPVIPVRQLMSRNLTLRFMLIYTIPAAALRTAVEEVDAAVAAGGLTELPVTRYRLDQIAEAHQAVEDGAVGKVVVEL